VLAGPSALSDIIASYPLPPRLDSTRLDLPTTTAATTTPHRLCCHHECPSPCPTFPARTRPLTLPKLVEWAFGKRMTPAERLRKHQRALEKTQRELDRERVKLENQEKKLVADIKKSAKNGQMGPLRIQAKDLVRTRRCVAACAWPWSACVRLSHCGTVRLTGHADTSRSSTRCAHSCRPSRCGYR
jgi:hypothetical protein